MKLLIFNIFFSISSNSINDSMLISRAPSEPNLRIPLQTSSSGIQLPPMITKEDSVYSESQISKETS